ncbi:hypothetical protein [Luteolibacter sp. Populi]|uniref:hypothetical protein n=1 Tax=Luteolibacter sp. Populi TaxID=3230487 RepID=UPI00346628CB
MRMLLLFLPVGAVLAADPPALTFQTHCSACHAVDHVLVGPSLVEVAGIYGNNPDDFVKWCVKPEHKRDGFIEMPSMAHLGEPVLRELHGYVMATATGKTEKKKSESDPYAVPPTMVRRPQVMRIFLPDASPAAIAVALPGDLSYCFDATECRLRYVWKGGFIDGWPYFKANGSSLAKIDGAVVYREKSEPLAFDTTKTFPRKFLGYRVGRDGIPSFRYQVESGATVEETVKALPDGHGIERQFTSKNGIFFVNQAEGAELTSSTGSLTLTPEQSKSFTLTYRWK